MRAEAGAVAVAAAAPVLARLRPTRLLRVLHLLTGRAVRTATPASVEAAHARAERALAIAARLHRPTCLTRGLARFIVLRRAGLPVELVFGMDGVADGHCWLELDRRPYLEPTDPRTRFPEILRVAGGGRA